MEAAINKTAKAYSRYGSSVHKQVYIYGSLDTRPVEINRAFGMAWGVGGWLLFPFLKKVGPVEGQKLRERVVASSRRPLPAITPKWCRCRKPWTSPTSRSTRSAQPARNS